MCDAMSALKLGLGLFQTMAARSEEQARIDEENQRRREQAIRTRNEADRAARLELEQIATREEEESIARSVETAKARKSSLQASAAARVAAAEGGVSGVSVDSLVGDYERSFREFNHQLDITEAFQARKTRYDTDVVDHKRQSRYDNSTPNYLSSPGIGGAIGQFAGSAIGAFGKWQSKQKPVSPRGNSFRFVGSGTGYDYLEF